MPCFQVTNSSYPLRLHGGFCSYVRNDVLWWRVPKTKQARPHIPWMKVISQSLAKFHSFFETQTSSVESPISRYLHAEDIGNSSASRMYRAMFSCYILFGITTLPPGMVCVTFMRLSLGTHSPLLPMRSPRSVQCWADTPHSLSNGKLQSKLGSSILRFTKYYKKLYSWKISAIHRG